MEKSLFLITSEWDEMFESFRMMPLTQDCPFAEVMYDPVGKVLVVFSKEKQEHFTTIPRIDAFGNPTKRKNTPLVDRHQIASFKEFLIRKPSEITEFIVMFAKNAGSFDFEKYMGELIRIPVKLRSTTKRKQ